MLTKDTQNTPMRAIYRAYLMGSKLDKFLTIFIFILYINCWYNGGSSVALNYVDTEVRKIEQTWSGEGQTSGGVRTWLQIRTSLKVRMNFSRGMVIHILSTSSDNNVHGANMGPSWGRQELGGSHVGPMNFVIWVHYHTYGVILKHNPYCVALGNVPSNMYRKKRTT